MRQVLQNLYLVKDDSESRGEVGRLVEGTSGEGGREGSEDHLGEGMVRALALLAGEERGFIDAVGFKDCDCFYVRVLILH